VCLVKQRAIRDDRPSARNKDAAANVPDKINNSGNLITSLFRKADIGRRGKDLFVGGGERSSSESSVRQLRVCAPGDWPKPHYIERELPTRQSWSLIDAQVDRSVGGKLYIRSFCKESVVDPNCSSKVTEASSCGCRCLCRTGANHSKSLIPFTRS